MNTITPEALAQVIRKVDGNYSLGAAALADAILAALPELLAAQPAFQAAVAAWMRECFLPAVCTDITERGDRMMEEVLELLQANGYDRARVATMVDYVYGRPVGEPFQEVGGVMVTLAAYCHTAGIDMHAAGDAELERITRPEVMAKIRRKHEAKAALHFDTPLHNRDGVDDHMIAQAAADGIVIRPLVFGDVAPVAAEAAPITLADWSLQMAAKESGQVVTAGAHGFGDAPAAASYTIQTEVGSLDCSLAVASEWGKIEEYIRELERAALPAVDLGPVLRNLMAAAYYMRNRVVETQGVKCMDDLEFALKAAEQALIDSQQKESSDV